MKINTVLFDLDGTLIDSLPLIQRTFERVFAEMNVSGSEQAMTWVGRPLREIGHHFLGERTPEFLELYQHYYALDHDHYTKVYPGTVEVLAKLQQEGYTLGVVTSKSGIVAQRSMDYLGLDKYLPLLIGAQDVTLHKPQPEPLLEALKRLKRQPMQSIYVGDSPFDILAAKAAAIKSVGVTWGMAERAALASYQPAAIIDRWEELHPHLTS